MLKPKIRGVLAEIGIVGVESIDDTESMLEAGLLDSLKTLKLITALEEDFSITIEDREVLPEHLDSIEGIAAFVATKLRR